jgi:hypothetical protein
MERQYLVTTQKPSLRSFALYKAGLTLAHRALALTGLAVAADRFDAVAPHLAGVTVETY